MSTPWVHRDTNGALKVAYVALRNMKSGEYLVRNQRVAPHESSVSCSERDCKDAMQEWIVVPAKTTGHDSTAVYVISRSGDRDIRMTVDDGDDDGLIVVKESDGESTCCVSRRNSSDVEMIGPTPRATGKANITIRAPSGPLISYPLLYNPARSIRPELYVALPRYTSH